MEKYPFNRFNNIFKANNNYLKHLSIVISILYISLWLAFGGHKYPIVRQSTVLIGIVAQVFIYIFISPIPWGKYHSNKIPRYRVILLSCLYSILSIIFLSLLSTYLYRLSGMPTLFYKTVIRMIPIHFPLMLGVGYLISVLSQTEKNRRLLEEEALTAQSKLLQSQLHPHVLFNSLNGIAELIHKDPYTAELSVRSLSNLLRRILCATEQVTFDLAEEKSILEDFISLESMRLGKRLKVHWEWDDDLEAIKIPPLLIQPLVENAIKHGISPNLKGGIILIILEKTNDGIRIAVSNTGEPFVKKSSNGIGVKNIKERLKLFFKEKASLNIRSEGALTVAEIIICTNESDFMKNEQKTSFIPIRVNSIS